jgi:hypothetical protein
VIYEEEAPAVAKPAYPAVQARNEDVAGIPRKNNLEKGSISDEHEHVTKISARSCYIYRSSHHGGKPTLTLSDSSSWYSPEESLFSSYTPNIMSVTNDQMDKSFLSASIPELLKQLTVSEKVSLLAGKDWWR